MNDDGGYNNEVRKGIQQLAGIHAMKHPLKKYKAYKKLIQIYMKQDMYQQTDREEEFRKISDRLRNNLKSIIKLNAGCGSNYVKGWLNIGLFPKEEMIENEIIEIDQALVLNFDLTANLPISSNSIEYIYASHFIEHLDFAEGITFLRQCYNLMRTGGIIRLTCPDMELWIRKYYENDTSFFNNYKLIFGPGIHPLIKTKGEIFMSQVHNWGHKWNYDFDSMHHLLQGIGVSRQRILGR